MARKGEAKQATVLATPVLEADASVSAENREAIERLAYSYWQARGCPIGSPEEDWYRAEDALRQRATAAAAG